MAAKCLRLTSPLTIDIHTALALSTSTQDLPLRVWEELTNLVHLIEEGRRFSCRAINLAT